MSKEAREIFDAYKMCLVRIETIAPDGQVHNGAGFHIGAGLVATAEHVVEYRLNAAIPERQTEPLAVRKIHRHPDATVDLAILETDFDLEPRIKNTTYHFLDGVEVPATELHRLFIPIGDHLDDWIGDEFILQNVVLLGYPRVPLARQPVLAASIGQINAVIDRYIGPHPFFLVSTMPRGGFSGGPAITEYGVLLGVITSSFVRDDLELELGFNGVISVEPLLTLLADNGLRPPGIDDEVWDCFVRS